MVDRQGFYGAVYNTAKSLGATDTQAHLAAAQASLETGYGAHVAGNNYFGIKAGSSYTGDSVNTGTHEVIDGQSVGQNADFRAYNGLPDSVKGYMDFMSQSFPGSWNAPTLDEASQNLTNGQYGSYATDPNYASKVTDIATNLGPAADVPDSSFSDMATAGILGSAVSPAAGILGPANTPAVEQQHQQAAVQAIQAAQQPSLASRVFSKQNMTGAAGGILGGLALGPLGGILGNIVGREAGTGGLGGLLGGNTSFGINNIGAGLANISGIYGGNYGPGTQATASNGGLVTSLGNGYSSYTNPLGVSTIQDAAGHQYADWTSNRYGPNGSVSGSFNASPDGMQGPGGIL